MMSPQPAHLGDVSTMYLSRLVTKPTKWHVRPAKTQISLGIRLAPNNRAKLHYTLQYSSDNKAVMTTGGL